MGGGGGGGGGEGEDVEGKVKDISIKDLSKKLEEFSKAREWGKYHTPRNLLLAMDYRLVKWESYQRYSNGEERWKKGYQSGKNQRKSTLEKNYLMYYFTSSSWLMFHVCGIDLGDAATKKIVKNGIKYPPKAF